ncbi:hypothetical protein JHK82_043312 [Glycine max]|nr:hypothetical protein JHK82_043312 [Glycine max]
MSSTKNSILKTTQGSWCVQNLFGPEKQDMCRSVGYSWQDNDDNTILNCKLYHEQLARTRAIAKVIVGDGGNVAKVARVSLCRALSEGNTGHNEVEDESNQAIASGNSCQKVMKSIVIGDALQGHIVAQVVRLSLIVGHVCQERLHMSGFYRPSPSQVAEWGMMSMCDTERRLLANALLDISNEWFILLSESCIPLQNFSIVYLYIARSRYSFMGALMNLVLIGEDGMMETWHLRST